MTRPAGTPTSRHGPPHLVPWLAVSGLSLGTRHGTRRLRPWLAVLGLSLSACGGARARTSEHPGERSPEPERVGEVRLLVVERSLGELAALGLFVDAGTLDATSPSVALVAAELAAEAARARSGRGVTSVVLPDGTAFHLLCERSALPDCVADLAAGLAHREVTDDAVELAHARVRAARERGAGSTRRDAEVLAASAALGVVLAPLGDAEDVVTASDVRAMLATHYGAARAMVVVVGDTSAAEVAPYLRPLEAARATAGRAERQPTEGPQVRAEEAGGPAVWSLALRTPGEAEALGAARAWARRGALVEGVTTAAFPTRAGWLATMTFPAHALDPRLAASWLDAPAAAAAAPAEGDAWAIVDRAGARWIAASAGAPPTSTRRAAAVVGDVPPEVLSAVEAQISGTAQARLEVTRVRADGSDELAVAWALGGAALDPPDAHGETSIAARVLAERCAPGATVDVRADAVIVAARGEPRAVLAELAFWRDCVRVGLPSSDAIERARRSAIAEIDAADERRALVAMRLAPSAPGAIAPRGSRRALSSVSDEDVRSRWSAWAADRGRLVVVGSERALASVARMTTDAPVAAPSATIFEPAGEAAPRERLEGAVVGELVVSAALSGCPSQGAATSLLDAWASAARARGARITWRTADVGAGSAWFGLSVAVAGDVDASVWALLPDAATRARLVGEGIERERREHAVSRADARWLASEAALAARAIDRERCAADPIVRITWLDPSPAPAAASGRR